MSLRVGKSGVVELIVRSSALSKFSNSLLSSLPLSFSPIVFSRLRKSSTAPHRKVYHECGDPGFAAFEARYPDQRLVIIVLANEDDSPVRDISDAMAKHLFGD